ncbi:MAG: PilZ domain-containing protein [Candidatus Acidiferrales bacterium]
MAEQSQTPEQQRRSPRQDTQVSVRVQGTLRDGQKLDEPAVVNQMSSHGVRVSLQKPLPNGTVVEVVVTQGRPATRYRVVWSVEDSAAGSWQLGMELVESSGATREPATGPPTGTGTVYE